MTTGFAGGCQGRGVVGRDTLLPHSSASGFKCTRRQDRTCKTSRGYFTSHGLGAHGFSTERARLARGTSLRSWFQEKVLRNVASRLIGALRFARGFKKSACYLQRF